MACYRAIGDIETETAALLVEHDISAPPFSSAQLAELPVDTPDNPWVMVCAWEDHVLLNEGAHYLFRIAL